MIPGASILRTSDGGQSWAFRLLPVLGVARAVEFRTPREGWAPMGLANRFIHIMNGGELWNEEYEIAGTAGAYDLCFPDSLHGYAVGGSGFFLKYNFFYLKYPFLSTPANGTVGIAPEPTLCWNPLAGTDTYQLQVSLAVRVTGLG